MAIKTFSAGEQLTASDTNTYLANAGLVFVKSQTIGSGVASVSVSSCFSSTYDNYFVIMSGGTASATGGAIYLQLGASTSDYYGFLVYGTYATATVSGAANNNASYWNWVGGTMGSNGAYAAFDLFGPNLAKYTRVRSQGYEGSANSGAYAGIHKSASAYTGFTLTPESGTLTGGTVVVYGYRLG